MEHTKGELKVRSKFPGLAYVEGETPLDDKTIFAVFPNMPRTAGEILQQKANAKHLVKCWNCHDDLLAACEKLVRGQLQHPTFERYVEHAVWVAEQAIAKAKL